MSCGVSHNSQNNDYVYNEKPNGEYPPSAPTAVSSNNIIQPVTSSGSGGCFLK
jgi:hypothetical protein